MVSSQKTAKELVASLNETKRKFCTSQFWNSGRFSTVAVHTESFFSSRTRPVRSTTNQNQKEKPKLKVKVPATNFLFCFLFCLWVSGSKNRTETKKIDQYSHHITVSTTRFHVVVVLDVFDAVLNNYNNNNNKNEREKKTNRNRFPFIDSISNPLTTTTTITISIQESSLIFLLLFFFQINFQMSP